jgi:hypothetical protein
MRIEEGGKTLWQWHVRSGGFEIKIGLSGHKAQATYLKQEKIKHLVRIVEL